MCVKLRWGVNSWEWKYATIVIHIKEYQEQFTLAQKVVVKTTKKCIPTLSVVMKSS